VDDRLVTLNPQLRNLNEKLLTIEQLKLEEVINLDEIKNVIFESNGNKTPELDGIPLSFYQRNWDLVKNNILILVTIF
jgi:hypothetical protein